MQVFASPRGFGRFAATGLALAGLTVAGLVLTAATRPAAPQAAAAALGLVEGTPTLKSAGALAFGPGSVLFVGDSAAAMVHAIDVKDTATDTSTGAIELTEIDRKIAALLGTTTDDLMIRDMKVHRPSQHVYLSVQRGRGDNATPVLVRASRDGKLERVAIEGVRYASTQITNAPAVGAKSERGGELRPLSITGLAFHENELFVAGLSKQEFASDLRRVPFPFDKAMASTSVEIFHTSHNKYETHSPITAFTPMKLKGVPTLLAGYGCAPIATFPIAALKNGAHVRGETLAELGGGNRPLDIIAFNRGGKDVVIIANSDRTLMRMAAEDLERAAPMTKGVDGPYVSAGAPFVAIARVGILQLDELNAEYAVVIQRDIQRGTLDLKSLPKKWM